jgi:UV DNA damage endonuclease
MPSQTIKIYDDAVDNATLNTFRRRCHLGLCCINNTLRKNKKSEIFCSRTCTRARFSVEKAQQLATQNAKDIIPILEYNRQHNIRHFRLSSDLLPHFTDSETERYSMDFLDEHLQRAGEFARQHNQRIDMHPGQFCVVGAKQQAIFDKTVEDLVMHATILDKMGIDDSGILCVHGGGTYGDRESAKRRWIDNFDDLPRCVKQRICIENCEKSYSVRDCLDIAQACKIPVILDSHHYNCWNHYHPDSVQEEVEDMMPEIIATWQNRQCTVPVMHVSEQKDNSPIGSHHDFVQTIPSYMLGVPEKYDTDLSIEVEAKAKEAAVALLQKRYNML